MTITSPVASSRLQFWMNLFLATGVYVAVGKLSLMLATLHPSASPVWPPTGIALATLLLFGSRFWPAILVGAFFVNVTTAGSIATSVAIAAGNTLEAVVGAHLVRRFAGGTEAFERVIGVFRFAILAGVVSTMISASIGVTSLALAGFADRNALPITWFTWWLGDMIGALTVAPLIILWSRVSPIRWNPERIAEAVVTLSSLLLISITVFSDLFADVPADRSLVYLSLLPILWTAIRFGPRETITLVVVLSSIAIAGTLRGLGPFAVASPNTSLLLMQLFIGVAAIMGMSLAAALRERKNTEESLESKVGERTRELASALDRDRANLQYLRNIADQMTVATVATDEHLMILHANEQFRTLFHIDAHSPLSSRSLLHVLREVQGLFQNPQYSLAVLGQMFAGHTQVRNRELPLLDGTVLSWDYIPIVSKGTPHGHLFLCRDVTEERRIDRAKTEFVSLASHQLRTPLTGIRWLLGRLEKMLGDRIGSEEMALVAEGKRAAARMCETVDTMLAIARMESRQYNPQPSRVALCNFLRQIGDLYTQEIQEKQQKFSILCPGEISLSIDEKLLKEILSNMLSNALKYTPEGGTVTVSARQDQDAVCIEVQDAGIGIPEEEQTQVFQKFFRAKNAKVLDQNGTGLGLYLAQNAAEMLGVELSFSSEVGRGTTFTLVIPLREYDETVVRSGEKLMENQSKKEPVIA